MDSKRLWPQLGDTQYKKVAPHRHWQVHFLTAITPKTSFHSQSTLNFSTPVDNSPRHRNVHTLIYFHEQEEEV